jgi:ABC-type branched-subunit amino acid transport system substrate-binding protein
MTHRAIVFVVILVSSIFCSVHAEVHKRKVGLIASLSGFAGPYGLAVKEGIELALSEQRGAGADIELLVQDDQSDPTKVISAYRYLKDIKGVELLIAGSWWVRPLAKVTERDGIPLLSCETMQDADFVPSATYFVLGGRVADWVRVYEPFFRARNLQTGAAIKFTSGFSQTISDEMRRVFSDHGRKFVGDFEYQDLGFSEARSILLKLRGAAPQVTYVDGQPEGLANFLKRRAEIGMQESLVVGHSAFETAITQRLVTPLQARNLFFLRRKPPNAQFLKSFEAMFQRSPVLSADLGYYAARMAVAAFDGPDLLANLRKGITVLGETIAFDENQVARGIAQEIHYVTEHGDIVKLEGQHGAG